ncbi:MAG: SDR family oxidoreductase [Pseudomonadota bacterium]
MGQANGRKSIFITGAASGIGAETARYFSGRGWFVGLYDIDAPRLSEVAATIGEDNCHTGALDVRDRGDWTRAVAGFCEATGGQMNVLFNNAGVGRHGWFEDIEGKDNDWIIDVNLKGVIQGVEACLEALKATPGARIINTASTAGIVGAPQLAVYSATKFAVRGLTEALDVEFSPLDIRVVSLMPWFIDTPILDMGASSESNERMADQIRARGAEVYPVSMAAEMTWEAAHGDDVHYMVGKDAKRARFAARFFPKRLRKRLVADLPARDAAP